MEHFRSILPPPIFPFKLSYADHFLGIGSCFVEQIAQRLLQRKFSCVYNPLGIAFNPYSVALGLQRTLEPLEYQAKDLFQHQELWHSFDHHGSFSATSEEATLVNIQKALALAHAQWQQVSTFLLTLGTANVWEYVQENRIVANCHKLPGAQFQRRRMGVAEIVDVMGTILQTCFEQRPQIKVILTVSPVRYLREGITENTRSKATLLLACETLCQQFEQVHYFPAYELVMDDLRDYRFYAEDLAHPNAQATDYVWTYFKQAFFDSGTQAQIVELEKLHLAQLHRPIHPDSVSHQAFLRQQLEYISSLQYKYPSLDLSYEKSIFQQQIKV